jgi:hypothetical protein
MQDAETYPTEPKRLQAFARFFKGYVGVSSVVTAALPIPATYIGLIPTYSFQTKLLSTYASLFCFLLLAFIFYIRHSLARLMFPDTSEKRLRREALARVLTALVPLVLIAGSLVFVFLYQSRLTTSVVNIRHASGLAYPDVTDKALLEKSDASQIPEAPILMLFYLGIFMTAEAAFILMAIKEYLQDVSHVTDLELIVRTRGEPRKDTSTLGIDTR